MKFNSGQRNGSNELNIGGEGQGKNQTVSEKEAKRIADAQKEDQENIIEEITSRYRTYK